MTFDGLLSQIRDGKITGKVCADSRKVTAGDVFVAIVGASENGHSYIADALKNGAKYIVCKDAYDTYEEIIITADPAKALGILAHASYGDPSTKLVNLAVTGTNGKTTVAYLVRSVLKTAGEKCGLIGTIEYDTGSGTSEAMLTTPVAADIAKLCSEMNEAGAKYMVTEASSHALVQDRLEGVGFKAAAFTNLTGDHRDYHKTEENYLAAKRMLFENLDENATAITNAQSPFGEKIVEKTKAMVLTYAVDDDADIIAAIKTIGANDCVYDLKFGGKSVPVTTKLLGRHNISNQLAAAGLCIAAGVDLETIAKGIEALEVVPGRLEPVECGQNFKVLVDYAHTDDAMKNVLETLRQICAGKLIVVFGCGGDRDKSKRPRMAKVAQEKADIIFVTSDNPRTENPKDIISDIVTGFADPYAENITITADRGKAIELAIKSAVANDIVLIAGKGHETYQIIGNEKADFDDSEVARNILKELK